MSTGAHDAAPTFSQFPHLSLNDDNLQGKLFSAQRLQDTMAKQPSRLIRSPRFLRKKVLRDVIRLAYEDISSGRGG
jgi:hypothetical protein